MKKKRKFPNELKQMDELIMNKLGIFYLLFFKSAEHYRITT